MNGKKFKLFRVANDLTLDQISKATGIGVSTLHRIENGIGRANDRTMYKIHKAFPELLRQMETIDEEFERLRDEFKTWVVKPKQENERLLSLFQTKMGKDGSKQKADSRPA